MDYYLVTGGAGFIGSHFVNNLLIENPDAFIIILDALSYAGDKTRISQALLHPHVRFIQGDINDFNLLNSIFEKNIIKKIIHFAAESHVDRSILGPENFMASNVRGTFSLLEVTRKYWSKNYSDKLFLHISTDEVFGSLSADENALTEASAFYRPSSPYSASKACSDHLVYAWHKTYGLPMIIAHCTNNYGAWQYPEKLIPLMINHALAGLPLPIYGDGLQVRDWLHVSDHCEALMHILHRGTIAERYYISGNNEQTNLEVVKKICTIVDNLIHPKKSTHHLITSVTDRLGHDRRYALDHSKMTQQFSWTPRQDFDQSLNELVQWYQHHQGWVKSIRSKLPYVDSLVS